ncbi:MAG: restriction endonuclease subunit S [Sedimentisphaerales bacterium]|jgi:restriction endonuclease S subunit
MVKLLTETAQGFSFVCNFAGLAKTPWLSARALAHKYIQFDLPIWEKKIAQKQGKKLIDFVSGFKSGEYIPKKHYTEEETKYVYLSVGCFSGDEITLEESTYLQDNAGAKYESLKLNQGDLVVTRSGTVGLWHLFNSSNDKCYIPSHHLSFTSISDPNIRIFLKYYLNSKYILSYIQAYSTGKSQKEINNWSIKRIPVPTAVAFGSVVPEINSLEHKITQTKRKIELLQDVIDDVLIANHIKNDRFKPILQEVFANRFVDIGKNTFMRVGAQYHAFYVVHNSLLFDSVPSVVPTRKLGTRLRLCKKRVLKKGPLDDFYILLDLDQLEPRSGKILSEDNIVTEIGSDKILLGDSDIVTSKMRPYLAYVFINDKEKNYIVSTELLPFKLLDNTINLQYLKYLLLSYDYIQKSKLLMYGKEHPRIHQKDLLSFHIPVPQHPIQEKIIAEIQQRENKSYQYKQEIKALRAQIDEIIYRAIA